MGIEVTAYDPDWPIRFEEVAAALRSALADGPEASVEHVGSTSVPGLAAKPILDIDVIVAPRTSRPRSLRSYASATATAATSASRAARPSSPLTGIRRATSTSAPPAP